MTALAVNTDRKMTGGDYSPRSLAASANPYQGSLMSVNSSGYVNELVAGEPFAGICRQQVRTADAPASNGDMQVDLNVGVFLFEMALSGIAVTDVGKAVFATDDNTLSLSPGSGTTRYSFVGIVDGYVSSGIVRVRAITIDQQQVRLGVVTLAATGNDTLTAEQVDKIIIAPATGAKTLTLPAAAACPGRRLMVIKSTSDAVAVTLDGNASETINGAATWPMIDQYHTVTLISDGSNWHVVAEKAAGYVNTAASAAVTNTATETAFDKTYSIPANRLRAGSRIRVKAQGIATATNSDDTLTVKAYVGSTELATTGAVNVANNDIFDIELELVIRTAGSSGTFVAKGSVGLGASGTVTLKGIFVASTAIDTTAAVVFSLKATWSVAHAGDSCRLDILDVQVID